MVFESGETDTVNGREVQVERREDMKDCTYSCGPREKKLAQHRTCRVCAAKEGRTLEQIQAEDAG